MRICKNLKNKHPYKMLVKNKKDKSLKVKLIGF